MSRTTRRDALLCGLGMLLIGLVALAFTSGLVEGVPSRRRWRVPEFPPPRWLAICASLVFVFGGLAVLWTHYKPRRAGPVFGALATLMLLTVLGWFVFMKLTHY
ncbi:hypothetical protein [Massilia sp. 9I]|uniref:hypothetical protein n=1 Tax=Massilia sp. 9I TaxID=2653152 RepID=UPI0012F3D405|nr:hypothetical protein [Massilia sp. 9I]VXC77875.1 membrane hypothetical protein [Massilia sp. 9I]